MATYSFDLRVKPLAARRAALTLELYLCGSRRNRRRLSTVMVSDVARLCVVVLHGQQTNTNTCAAARLRLCPLVVVRCPFREEHLVVCRKFCLYICHFGEDVPIMSHHIPPWGAIGGYWCWPGAHGLLKWSMRRFYAGVVYNLQIGVP